MKQRKLVSSLLAFILICAPVIFLIEAQALTKTVYFNKSKMVPGLEL
jgi:hypothetical protein